MATARRTSSSDLDGHSAVDDLICLPGHIGFSVTDVGLKGTFSRKISLTTQIVSSPMDTSAASRTASRY